MQEAGDAPQHAQRFEGAGGHDAAAIERFPTELLRDLGDLRLGAGVVAAEKHGGHALLVARVHHPGVADAVEGLDHARLRSPLLNLLAQRFVRSRGVGQHALDGRPVGDGIGGIHHRFPGEVGGAGEINSLQRGAAQSGEHHQFAELRRLVERARRSRGVLAEPVAHLLFVRVARSQHHLMAMLEESRAQHFADDTGPEDSNLHWGTTSTG